MQHIDHKTGRKLILTAVYAAYILFIFSNSMQDADASTLRSSAVLELMREFIDGTVGQFFPEAASFLTEYIIRKAAHFTEFALLGVLGVPVFAAYAGHEEYSRRAETARASAGSVSAIDGMNENEDEIAGCLPDGYTGDSSDTTAPEAARKSAGYMQTAVYTAFAGLITALMDETIQLFSAGRSSQVTDVWIDFAGCVVGIVVCTAICTIANSHNNTT